MIRDLNMEKKSFLSTKKIVSSPLVEAVLQTKFPMQSGKRLPQKKHGVFKQHGRQTWGLPGSDIKLNSERQTEIRQERG